MRWLFCCSPPPPLTSQTACFSLGKTRRSLFRSGFLPQEAAKAATLSVPVAAAAAVAAVAAGKRGQEEERKAHEGYDYLQRHQFHLQRVFPLVSNAGLMDWADDFIPYSSMKEGTKVRRENPKFP